MTRRIIAWTCLLVASAPAIALAQQAAEPEGEFQAGQPLGITPEGGEYTPISDNVRVYGTIVNTESCIYDEERGLILAPARGANQHEVPNDGFVSLLNSDGTVHTAKWIGATRDGLVLNHPFGSDIHDGTLYLADRDGGLTEGEPTVSVLRMFDMETGAPAGEIVTEESPGFNDIEVAEDGTVYASQTNAGPNNAGPETWRLFRVTPEGEATVLVEGPPLNLPNGVGIDGEGNIVVVNIGDDAVLTFSPEGELLETRHAAQAGSDGIVIMEDGTTYVSSVRQGGISRIPADGGEAELIATGIPNAASMCYDSGANQLVIPMNQNHAFAFVPLD